MEKQAEIMGRFAPVFMDESKVMIGQNLKYDLKVLARNGYEVKNELYDTMLAHYLLHPDSKHGMDFLAETYLHYKPISIETLIGKKGKNQQSMADLDPQSISDYAAEDADITFQLKQLFAKETAAEPTHKLLHEIELPLLRVLCDIEQEGVNLDVATLKSYSVELGEKVDVLEREIQDLAGETFNVDSPKQLGPILFEKLAISSKAKKTKTGQYSTGEDVLSKHLNDHEIVPKILQYRQLKKLKSTYVDPLPSLVNVSTGRFGVCSPILSSVRDRRTLSAAPSRL